ncbi:hypothetical protein JL_80 [Bacillus phage JL]|uniref:Uncharacterized protein n=1 Tax=Bacillus phage JL TaxID=1296655 RepID=V5TFP3_9CAUD|nr:hypothetical protein AVV47_gp216 [Bacillus phage JL]AHB63469.1 hypothetical protein JL_80 [Bacillus phage JL]
MEKSWGRYYVSSHIVASRSQKWDYIPMFVS